MLVYGKGRETIFLHATEEECRRSWYGLPVDASGLRLTYIGHPLNAAIVVESKPGASLRQAVIQSRFAALDVDMGDDLREILQAVCQLTGHFGAQEMVLGEEIRKVYGMGQGELAIARAVGMLSERDRRRTTVFAAGMLGQDVADRLRGTLGVERVFEADVRAPVRYMLHRLGGQTEQVARFMYLLAEFLPPVENAALHLAVGE